MNQPILRHIRNIEYCAAYHLKRVIILPVQAQALVHEPMPWQKLPLVGIASLEVTDEVDNGVRIYTSKLTATLCKPFLYSKCPTAFRLTDVQDRTYLLGTSLPPYSLVSQVLTCKTEHSKISTTILSINHLSTYPLLSIDI